MMKKILLSLVILLIIKFSGIAANLKNIEYGTLKINNELVNNNNLKIFFIDVDQGDAALIITPDNKVIFIDAGFWGAGDFIIKPILDEFGIDTIDKIFISHAHGDHHAGTMYLLETFKVGKFYDPGLDVTAESYKEIIELAIKKNVDYSIPQSNSIIYNNNDFQIIILQNNVRQLKSEGINNNSMVVSFKYKDFSVLFTGDVEARAENILVKNTQFPLKSDVLKVPHHGSGTSSTNNFVKHVAPEVAIISVGHKNRYRHPSSAIVKKYEQHGKVFRTDHNGHIFVESDGTNYSVKTQFKDRHNNPEVSGLIEEGWGNLWRQKDTEKGIDLLRQAFLLEPDNPEVNSKLGYALYSDTQYEEAKIHLHRALELDPQDYYARINLAKIYQSNEEFQKAIHILEEAVLIKRHGRDMDSIYKWIKSLKEQPQ